MSSEHSIQGPAGVQNPAVLDLVTHDPVTGLVTFVMIEDRPWNGGEKQLFQIQEKINSYLSFILDGEMAESHPQFVGKPVALQLDCPDYPNDPVIDFLDRIQQQLEKESISFTLRVREKVPSPQKQQPCSSHQCQCHSPT